MTKFFKRIALVLALIFSVLLIPTESLVANGTEEPIMTIACLSDLHNQQSLINGSVDEVRLRGTINTTLEKIKETENIDAMLLLGDYTSDVDNALPEANWLRIRELMTTATRKSFQDNDGTMAAPVIYVNGNHEYDCAYDRSYNCGDYYTSPMSQDIGALSSEDSFYENTNDGKFSLLAAYHYVLNGFDFVVLNTGKEFYDNDWCYQSTNSPYSIESVNWVSNKLEEIYASDPNKTVFFLCHVPFSDSNSLSNSNKGMNEALSGSANSTKVLKDTLSKYPNLIYIYGHDHGTDSAYIRTDTAQRVTEYDTNGNVIANSSSTDALGDNDYYIINSVTNKYLGFSSNLDTVASPSICTATSNSSGFNIAIDGHDYVYFSSNSLTFSNNTSAKTLYLYKINSQNNGTYSCSKATTIEDNESYLIVYNNNGTYYALSNKTNGASGSDLRLEKEVISVSGNTATYKDSNQSDDYSAVWMFSKATPEPTESGEKSFISTFAGSMRYYNNSIDGSVGASDSRIIQALIIYVYSDRVELHMKNYGESGTINGITIAESPTPYISYRTVTNSGSGSQEEILPTEIELCQASATMNPGDTLSLSATVLPSTASNKTVTWSSSNSSIASVSNGLVTAISQGTATITATTVNGLSKSCTINVNSIDPTSISLDKSNAALTVGSTTTLTATVLPNNASDTNVTWTSSNNSIATVVNGTVTAVSAGNVVITATTSNGLKADCNITVTNNSSLLPEDVTLTKEHVAYLNTYNNTKYLRTSYNLSRRDLAVALYNLLSEETKEAYPGKTNRYNDMSRLTSLEKKAVNTLYDSGIFKGIYDGSTKFSYSTYVKRGELAQILANFTGYSYTQDTVNSLYDINSSTKYSEAIWTAVDKGWISSYSDGYYRPSSALTRLQFVYTMNSFLDRTISSDTVDFNGITLNSFRDLKTSSTGYLQLVEATTGHTFVIDNGVEVWQTKLD